MLIKAQKAKANFGDNQFHNILRLFDVLQIISITTNEMIELPHDLRNDLRLRILGNK